MKVMVVDDEPSIRALVDVVVKDAGYECVCCSSGVSAFQMFSDEHPDIVILDIMMPKVDGFEVCRRIREVDDHVPVLFLSAKGDIVDKRVGFANGCDDYIVKPFDDEELLMRIKALARRVASQSQTDGAGPKELDVGEFRFDTLKHLVTKHGDPIILTPKEFQLVYLLASHAGEVMSKEELIQKIWGTEYLDGSISIAVYMRRIREKVEDDPARPEHLKTVWGVGYVFQ